MKVFLSRKAARALDDTPPETRRRLKEKISELLRTPYATGCRKLRGAPNAYRLRVGDHRILYAIVSKAEVLVFKVGKVQVVETEEGILLKALPRPQDDFGSLTKLFKGKTAREVVDEARAKDRVREKRLSESVQNEDRLRH